jgi:hypothetical protein
MLESRLETANHGQIFNLQRRDMQSPVVASAVLVSAYHLLQWNVEIVKRWSNEIQEAVQSKAGMVQVRNALQITGSHVICNCNNNPTSLSLRSSELVRRSHQALMPSCAVPCGGTAARPAQPGPASGQQAGHEPGPQLRPVAPGTVPPRPLCCPGVLWASRLIWQLQWSFVVAGCLLLTCCCSNCSHLLLCHHCTGDCRVRATKRNRAPSILRLPGGLPAAQGRDGHLRGRPGDLRHAGRLLSVGHPCCQC